MPADLEIESNGKTFLKNYNTPSLGSELTIVEVHLFVDKIKHTTPDWLHEELKVAVSIHSLFYAFIFSALRVLLRVKSTSVLCLLSSATP